MSVTDHYVVEPLERRLLLSGGGEDASVPDSFTMPALFVENDGQWDHAIDFAAHGAGADILFTDTGPMFRLVDGGTGRTHGPEHGSPASEYMRPVPRDISVTEWSLTFVDAQPVEPTGTDPQHASFNYYLGDPSTWRTDVTTYAGVVYNDLWAGIDGHALARERGMKYEFHLAPGADPAEVVLRYDGIDGLSLADDGSLRIETPAGTITDDAPVAWQTLPDGGRIPVPAEFVLLDDDAYTITPTELYDPSLPLVLDPQLEFGSFLGGSGNDIGWSMASDGAGGAWVTGSTTSSNFPTPGGFDTTYNSGDVFIARVAVDGALAFASFLGGSRTDVAHNVASDGVGGAWLTGYTWSTDFPTPGGFDTTHNGGYYDSFVARVMSDGTLSVGSYLGGGGNFDLGMGIASDGAGGAWVTGITDSADFPTPGGFDGTYNGDGDADIFVAQVTAGGALAFGSYLGGGGADQGVGITSDGSGGVWLTGLTASTNFPTPGGFDTTYNGGGLDGQDAFVARVTVNGALAFASYLGGGNGDDVGLSITTDGAGGAWVTGRTRSAYFPTPGGFDTTYNSQYGNDAFVARVTASGALAFGSYLGGSGTDEGRDIIADGSGGVWLTGTTRSDDFPTPGGFDTTHNLGAGVDDDTDAFVARVTAGGVLAFGSYLGGGADDEGSGLAPDGAGGVWVVGTTRSVDFPTPGGFDTTYNGNQDVFITRVGDDADITPPQVTSTTFAFEAQQAVRFTFSEDVLASLSVSDLVLMNLSTDQSVAAGDIVLAYDPATNTATFTFTSRLPDGNYVATLPAGSVVDANGNAMQQDATLDFFVLAGDADRDRDVDFFDFLKLRSNYGTTNKLFSDGDFDYDGDVDFFDFLILRGNYGVTLPPPGGSGSLFDDGEGSGGL